MESLRRSGGDAAGGPAEPKLINTCYSLVAPDYGISSGVSPTDAPRSTRALEANYADGWFTTITDEVFG